MRKTLNRIGNVVTCLLAVLAVCMMIFTIVAVTSFDRTDRDIFGYRMFIVLSDSMSATDFRAGDLIIIKETDPANLAPGDIIAYQSQGQYNYGEIVTHKIRSLTTDAEGNPGFITYGTSTGIDDTTVVTWQYVLGRYEAKLPGVGKFFQFLKTVPGYIILILIPFLLLIISQGVNCVRQFREYRKEQLSEILAERELLQKEREENKRMLEEMEMLKRQMETNEEVDE